MNKKTIKTICTVIIAVCAIALIFGVVEMLFSALSTDDMLAVTGTYGENKKLLLLGKWTMLALSFVVIAAGVISVFSYFGKSKVLSFLAGGMHILTALLAIAFVIAVYIIGKGELDSSTTYSSGVLFCEKYLQVAVASAVLGAYYTTCAVQSLRNKDCAEGADKADENCDIGGSEENEKNV